MSEQSIYEKAIAKFGAKNQLLKAVEERHEKFFKEWLIDYNATRAYCVTYKRVKTQSVCVMASKLLSYLLIQAKYKALLNEHNEKLEDTAWLKKEYVINNLKELTERCMQKTPVMEFDYINKELVQKTDDDGKSIWQFDSKGAGKGLELLGKHLQLFTDKIEHSGHIDHEIEIIPPKGLKKRGVENAPQD